MHASVKLTLKAENLVFLTLKYNFLPLIKVLKVAHRNNELYD